MSTVKAERTFTESEVNEIVRARLARQARKKAVTVPQEEQRSTADLISAAGRFTAELPSYGFDRWLKGAREMRYDLLTRKEELRAEDPEAVDLQKTLALLEENMKETEALYEERMHEVKPEQRSLTRDQEIDVVLDYAFKPEGQKEEIRRELLRTAEDKNDPSAKVLRSIFLRG